jgi:tetraacyldisaccharide 4'-kinase
VPNPDPLPNGGQRYLLFPLALFYWGVIFWRNLFYQIGFFVTRRLPCRVISVGNLTTGGTGKTPLVMALARLLQQEGQSVAVLSRGYGRRTSGTVLVTDGTSRPERWETVGDEPYLMAHSLRGVPIVVDENRYRGGSYLVRHFAPDVIILDDAFQHRAIDRDVDVVLINSGDRRRDHKLLPYGLLREPWIHLRRADLVFLTKTNLHKPAPFLKSRLNRLPIPWYPCSVRVGTTVRGLHTVTRPVTELQGKPVLTVSAVGDPDGFERTVALTGANRVGQIVFPDHHHYTPADLRRLKRTLKQTGAEWILTTEKDLVKLEGLGTDLPIYALPIETALSPAGRRALLNLILTDRG